MVTTGAGGAVAVRLSAGRYRVTAAPAQGTMRPPLPVTVTVRAGGTTRLRLLYDTGIR
jgi:hypothetical protein